MDVTILMGVFIVSAVLGDAVNYAVGKFPNLGGYMSSALDTSQDYNITSDTGRRVAKH